MNREQFNSALNGISDGLIEEAAGAYEKKSNQKRTLLQWVAAGLAEQHRRKTVIAVAAAGLCLAVVLAAAGVIWGGPAGVTDPTQPTISMENPTMAPDTQPADDLITEPPTQPVEDVGEWKIAFLSEKNGQKTVQPLDTGIEFPIDIRVMIQDLRGLNEEERIEAKKQQDAFLNGNDWHDGGVMNSYSGEDVFVATSQNGFFSILLDPEVSSVNAENTNKEMGRVGQGSTSFYSPDKKDEFHCDWSLEVAALVENPGTQLATIHDTILITICYKDGTTEVIEIDISINNEGQVFATLAADPLSA